MTEQEFLNICRRVDSGETICVKRDDGNQGKVLGCLIAGEAFDVEVGNSMSQEVWHRTRVVGEVPC